MTEREGGYYWVKGKHGITEPAQYDAEDDRWWTLGSEEKMFTKDFKTLYKIFEKCARGRAENYNSKIMDDIFEEIDERKIERNNP